MINADVFFVIVTIIFGLIGTMRGWIREIIVTASLILGIFVINQFNSFFVNLTKNLTGDATVSRFLVWSAPFLIIAFFGYLGPAVVRNRFAPNPRGRIEEGIIAFLCGCVNGFLVFSTLAYLAWKAGILTPGSYPPNANPPLFTAPPAGWESFFFIKNSAVLFFTGPTLILVLVAVFLFIIIVII